MNAMTYYMLTSQTTFITVKLYIYIKLNLPPSILLQVRGNI